MDAAAMYEALAELRDRLGQLRTALEPGTPRRWGQRDLTRDEWERLDYHAYQDRAAKLRNSRLGLYGCGESAAPLRIGVLEATTAIETGALDLERIVCKWLGITPLAGVDTAERITRVIGLLDRIAGLQDLAFWVDTEVARLGRIARRAVGDAEPVYRIAGRCPICDGMSLRAFPEREQVVCVNAACRCADEGCICHRGRRHRWLYAEWPWLAQILADDLEQVS